LGYYEIGKHHVFMTEERENIAAENALADKDVFFRVRMAFDSPERRLGQQLIHQFLEREYKSNPTSFGESWVNLEFDSDQSIKYGWDLLYDYCCTTHAASLVELRSDHGQMMADWYNENFTHPMGKVFRLQALSKGWFSRRPTFGVTVNLNKIRSIKGIPSNFVVYADGLTLLCGAQVTVS